METELDNPGQTERAVAEPDKSDDELREILKEPVDELDCELQQMADTIVEERLGEDAPLCTRRMRQTMVDQGRPLAILSYFSVMFGVPVFLIPFVLRDNEFSLHHSKAAGVIFAICTIMLIATLTNGAFFLPLVFVCYIPALIGMYRAAAGVEAGTTALGPVGERIFRRIEVKK